MKTPKTQSVEPQTPEEHFQSFCWDFDNFLWIRWSLERLVSPVFLPAWVPHPLFITPQTPYKPKSLPAVELHRRKLLCSTPPPPLVHLQHIWVGLGLVAPHLGILGGLLYLPRVLTELHYGSIHRLPKDNCNTYLFCGRWTYRILKTKVKMNLSKITKNIQLFAFNFLTFTYTGPLHHYTLEPINNIAMNQDDLPHLPTLLYDFRLRKEEELQFVQRAVNYPSSFRHLIILAQTLTDKVKAALATAVVIGIFSWQDVSTTFWISHPLWHFSLSLSIIALISSAHQRLLEKLPNTKEITTNLSVNETLGLLRVILRPARNISGECTDIEKGESLPRLVPSNRLIWVWQSPVMLMSLSWFWFLIGFLCHLLKPIFTCDLKKAQKGVSCHLLPHDRNLSND